MNNNKVNLLNDGKSSIICKLRLSIPIIVFGVFLVFTNTNAQQPTNVKKQDGKIKIIGEDTPKHQLKEKLVKINEFLNPTACVTFSNVAKTNQNIHFINCSKDALSFFWKFGDGVTSKEINPFHIYETTGVYNVELIASNENKADTSFQKIHIIEPAGNFMNCLSITPISINLINNKWIDIDFTKIGYKINETSCLEISGGKHINNTTVLPYQALNIIDNGWCYSNNELRANFSDTLILKSITFDINIYELEIYARYRQQSYSSYNVTGGFEVWLQNSVTKLYARKLMRITVSKPGLNTTLPPSSTGIYSFSKSTSTRFIISNADAGDYNIAIIGLGKDTTIGMNAYKGEEAYIGFGAIKISKAK